MSKVLKELSRTPRIPFNRYFAFRRLKEYHARAVAAPRPKTILEIGTVRGGTLLIWSASPARRLPFGVFRKHVGVERDGSILISE